MTLKRSTRLAAVLALGCLGLAGIIQAKSSNTTEDSAVHSNLRKPSDKTIAIRIGEKTFAVDLYDNETAKDLITKLPLTLKAGNYPGYDEKVIRLKDGLSMKGAPRGDEPEIPEVGYYEPGQWIALYYGYIGYWPGKVPLGRIHASVDEVRAIPDGAPVTIEVSNGLTGKNEN
ncbi:MULTISPECIES: cyclophilin-like fold protein [unclassified Rhizobium]|uniref:cyclophilin-like fold protein n=1 Tax=unclassified Rhizobium TaxID=2613769 RepID=UPI000CDF3203|nr:MULTISPECIES: cyclophilin-like fold protein [Rhizobium]AVA21202.1 cyclophilin-like domain-containing protein [Rhizobium sp. NXC24]MDK4739327.1 cyclophilin-like fold protein [Rhizobium sp. CNPSo 3464]UWU22374.1 cyclophilin-like fold protein [Rhizobium tropici]